MSNKEHEKLDGVFDSSSGEKGEKAAAKADKPARPPKPKTSLSRETKVGLAVIAALLVIFVVVLVVRLRGGSGEPVAKDTNSSSGAADTEKPKKERQKALPAASRTLIANQSGAPAQPQYLYDASSGKNDGLGAGSAYAGSAYAKDDRHSPDQGAPPAGYLPARMGQNPSLGSAAVSDLQADANAASERDNSLRPDQHTVQDRSGGTAMDASKLSPGAANPFSPRFTLGHDAAGASHLNESITNDERDAEDEVATQAGAAPGNPFDNRTVKGIENESKGASSNSTVARPRDLQTKNSTPAGGFGNANERASANDAEDGEAERFIPNGLRSVTGGSRLNGNNLGAQKDDTGKESIDADQESDAGNLKPLDRIEFPHGQQNLASAPRQLPTKGKAPFSAPSWSATEPAHLDDAVPGANGDGPAPLRGQLPSDQGMVHVVAAGDTYWTIAKKTYESGAYFKALYEHNRRRLNNADSLRPGTQLMLPDEATLQRLYPTLCPRPPRLAAAARATRANFNSATGGQEYVVSDGDTLYDVARRRLGNASRWAEVYELNRDAIGAATDRLEPGARLVLPANN